MVSKIELQILNAVQSGNYSAANKLIQSLTEREVQAFSPVNMEQIMFKLASSIAYGLANTNVDAPTDTIRNFASKLSPVLTVSTVDVALNVLATQIDLKNSADYRAIDAITDNMSAGLRQALSSAIKETVILSISHNVIDGLVSHDANLVEQSTIALRDFMSKFGSTLGSDSVDNALTLLSSDISFWGYGDYRSIDAITDYMTTQAKADLSLSVKTQVIDNITNTVIDGHMWSNGSLHDKAIVALDDFISKFSASLTIDTVSQATERLINVHDGFGLSAIIDNVTTPVLNLIKNTLAADLIEAGYDVYTNSASKIIDGAESSTIFALDGNDVVSARDGNDIVFGGKGNDTLYGDNGDDILSGGSGADTLYGSAGSDTFMVESFNAGDRIMDFHANEGDKLDLTKILDGFDPVTHAITEFVTATTVNGVISLAIDVDGTTGPAGFVEAVTFYNVTGLDIVDLYNNGQIIV